MPVSSREATPGRWLWSPQPEGLWALDSPVFSWAAMTPPTYWAIIQDRRSVRDAGPVPLQRTPPDVHGAVLAHGHGVPGRDKVVVARGPGPASCGSAAQHALGAPGHQGPGHHVPVPQELAREFLVAVQQGERRALAGLGKGEVRQGGHVHGAGFLVLGRQNVAPGPAGPSRCRSESGR